MLINFSSEDYFIVNGDLDSASKNQVQEMKSLNDTCYHEIREKDSLHILTELYLES